MEAMKISSGNEIKWQFEEYVSKQVQSPYYTERSKLSALEVAAKIWANWKLCEELSINLNSGIKVNCRDHE